MDLAHEIASEIPIDDFLDWAFSVVTDNHCRTNSDDMIDYCNSAAQVYAELWTIKRYGHGSNEVTEIMLAEWLAQPVYEWLATDGDLRWFLGDFIHELQPVLAQRWTDYSENALND